MLQGKLLYGAGVQFPAPARLAIGLGKYGNKLMGTMDNGLQVVGGKFRGAGEYYLKPGITFC